MGWVVRDNNLFRRAATIAPKNPIQRVRCCTNTGDATTPVVPKIRVKTSIAGSNTRAINTNRVMPLSMGLIFTINKSGLRFNGHPSLF
jgi:hypothetical protein